jgi:DNA polymerase IV
VRADHIRKSIGAENTFSHDLDDFESMRDGLQPILDRLWCHCENAGMRGRTVTLKVKYADFKLITRSRSLSNPIAGRGELEQVSLDLLSVLMPVPKRVRLLGITPSTLSTEVADGGLHCHGAATELQALSDRLKAPLIHSVKGQDILP